MEKQSAYNVRTTCKRGKLPYREQAAPPHRVTVQCEEGDSMEARTPLGSD